MKTRSSLYCLKIEADDGRTVPVLTMGPIRITPEWKRRGYGKKLPDYSLEKAAAMGFGAVLIINAPAFWKSVLPACTRSFQRLDEPKQPWTPHN